GPKDDVDNGAGGRTCDARSDAMEADAGAAGWIIWAARDLGSRSEHRFIRPLARGGRLPLCIRVACAPGTARNRLRTDVVDATARSAHARGLGAGCRRASRREAFNP